jgi:hypothetical protein
MLGIFRHELTPSKDREEWHGEEIYLAISFVSNVYTVT